MADAAQPGQQPPQQQPAAPPSLEGLSADEVNSLALTARQLRDNPQTRGLYLRMLKASNPSIAIPEVDVEVRTARALAERDKQIKEMQDRENLRAQREHAVNLFETLREDGVVRTRAEFSELVKYANDSGFHTTEMGLRKARSYRDQESASGEPTPQNFRPLIPKDNKDLMRNPREWARKEAQAAISELMRSRTAA